MAGGGGYNSRDKIPVTHVHLENWVGTSLA